ncbi:MAG: GumC family protein [Armatimonadota bacterium]
MAVEEEEITLADLFGTIWQRKRTVAVITILCGLIGVLATWLPAPVYEASSTLLFPAGGVSSLAGLAQSFGISVPSGGTAPLKMYRAVLESDRIRALISQKTNTPPKKLRQITSIKDDIQASLITVSVRHKDPRMAQRIAKLYVSTLATLNRELNLPLARNQVEFLEKELALRVKQLREAENRLLQFQKQMVQESGAPSAGGGATAGISSVSPLRALGSPATGLDSTYLQQLNSARLQLQQVNEQIATARASAQKLAKSAANLPADLPPAAQWRQKLTDLEYELRVAELTYGPDAPNVVRLKKQIELTRQQLRKEIDNYLQAVNMNLDPNLAPLELQRVGLEAQINALQQLAARAPEDTLKLQRLAREVATLNDIVQQLRVNLEQARMEMSRDPNRWEVLEDGTLKEEPVNKRWKLNIALALTGGLMLGVLAVLFTNPKR